MYFENKWSLVELGSEGEHFSETTFGQPWTEPFDQENPIFSRVYFRTGSKRRVFNHEPYKAIDLMGDLGGMLEIFLASGSLITFFYVKESY